MTKYFTFGISISFISWIVGMILNGVLLKTPYYKNLSNLNFISSKNVNQYIGIKYFRWIVKNTFFKFFNPKIQMKDKRTDLVAIRKEMTIAEISHLIAFLFVTVFAVYKTLTHNFLFGLVIMIVNILMNLYPSLLQQENKRRMDRLIKRKIPTADKRFV